jgi:8-amino-7-oxononanoate synthase
VSLITNNGVTAICNWWHQREIKSNSARPRSLRSRRFEELTVYKALQQYVQWAEYFGIENPFFRQQDAHHGTTTIIGGREYLNFAVCDYLGLSLHPSVIEGAKAALSEYGTCVSASRIVGGELPLHQLLEKKIAAFCGTEDAIVFVSGHAANPSTISTLIGEGDLILHDEFVHNSVVVGARLSRATILSFHHNNLEALEKLLARHRARYRHALIAVEGSYSTEADIPDLLRLIELKDHYGAWLMVDDAHGLGVLGSSGRGVAELFRVDARKIDILMGTLSKSLASCGGFIAGEKSLIEILKYKAPGFVFSVGLPPVMAAAALAALQVIENEPERISRLQANARFFFEEARRADLDTGNACVHAAMVPIMAGGLSRVGKLMNRVSARGINASPIIYPGVPINAGRLRFFITSEHSVEQLGAAVSVTKEELDRIVRSAPHHRHAAARSDIIVTPPPAVEPPHNA